MYTCKCYFCQQKFVRQVSQPYCGMLHRCHPYNCYQIQIPGQNTHRSNCNKCRSSLLRTGGTLPQYLRNPNWQNKYHPYPYQKLEKCKWKLFLNKNRINDNVSLLANLIGGLYRQLH